MNRRKTLIPDRIQSHGLTGLLCLSLAASFAVVEPPKKEPASSSVPATRVYWNPLTLNGRPIDLSSFSVLSRGVLSIVEIDAAEGKPVKVPFRVYVRRAGEIVCGQTDGEGVLEVNIQPMLAMARPGDELVIERVRPADSAMRQIIRLRPFNWMITPGDGC